MNIRNCVNSIRNYVHYMYRMYGFTKKLNIQNFVNSTGNCVHYMYRSSRFVEKFKIQNSVNSTGNCVHKCTDGMDFQKNWISWIA